VIETAPPKSRHYLNNQSTNRHILLNKKKHAKTRKANPHHHLPNPAPHPFVTVHIFAKTAQTL
jgi:hypothetical protein